MKRKPLQQKAYGSIPHLSSSKLGPKDYHIDAGQEKILTQKVRDKHDVIIVQEKLDGSNVAVAKIDGQIIPMVRAGYIAWSSPWEQHQYFCRWVQKREKLFDKILNPGEWLSGEWLLQAHGIRYQISNENLLFRPFDLFTGKRNKKGTKERLCFMELRDRIHLQDDILPLRAIHENQSISLDNALIQLRKFLQLQNESEGLVYRCERNGNFDFIAKYVKKSHVTGKYLFDKEPIWNYNPELI